MRQTLFIVGGIFILLGFISGIQITVDNGIIGITNLILGIGIGLVLIGMSEIIWLLERILKVKKEKD